MHQLRERGKGRQAGVRGWEERRGVISTPNSIEYTKTSLTTVGCSYFLIEKSTIMILFDKHLKPDVIFLDFLRGLDMG
jgi:hypothetical protein